MRRREPRSRKGKKKSQASWLAGFLLLCPFCFLRGRKGRREEEGGNKVGFVFEWGNREKGSGQGSISGGVL
jgi:hypothetical protein